MAVFLNMGYTFSLKEHVEPDGFLLLPSKIHSDQLSNRLREKALLKKFPYIANRLLDPQIYASSLDISSNYAVCRKLASYPWYGSEWPEIDENEDDVKRFLDANWIRNLPREKDRIRDVVMQCINYQIDIGCSSIILPSPITTRIDTDYEEETMWLDFGIECCKSLGITMPILATFAIVDNCFRLMDPIDNLLIPMILDVLMSREINGVYFIVEQGGEKAESRYISNIRTLWSSLHIVHELSRDPEFDVTVNYFGPFGVALRAAGARNWIFNWYKSLVRFRLSDEQGFAAFPTFWSFPCAIDINMKDDFDKCIENGLFDLIADWTYASDGLLKAASAGVKAKDIPSWRYSQSNTVPSIEHYQLSLISVERRIAGLNQEQRILFVSDWLNTATSNSERISHVLGQNMKTKIDHVQSWHNAFLSFRRDQNI